MKTEALFGGWLAGWGAGDACSLRGRNRYAEGRRIPRQTRVYVQRASGWKDGESGQWCAPSDKARGVRVLSGISDVHKALRKVPGTYGAATVKTKEWPRAPRPSPGRHHARGAGGRGQKVGRAAEDVRGQEPNGKERLCRDGRGPWA